MNDNLNKSTKNLENNLSKFVKETLKRSFPIDPYDIQTNIAENIYSSLENNSKKILIIESPTGTGKSYSLLVPILNWIK